MAEAKLNPGLQHYNEARSNLITMRADACIQIVNNYTIKTQEELMQKLEELYPHLAVKTRITLQQTLKRAGIIKDANGIYRRPIWSPKDVRWGIPDAAQVDKPLRDEYEQGMIEELLRGRVVTDVFAATRVGNLVIVDCSKDMGHVIYRLLINLNWPGMRHANPAPDSVLVICDNDDAAETLRQRLLLMASHDDSQGDKDV